ILSKSSAALLDDVTECLGSQTLTRTYTTKRSCPVAFVDDRRSCCCFVDLVGRTVGDRVQPLGCGPYPARATEPQSRDLTRGDFQSAVSQNTLPRPSQGEARSGS